MEITLSFKMSVTERSETAEARRRAEGIASGLGFSKAEIGSIAIIITEVAKNLAKYATKGEIIVQTIESEGRFGIEMLAVDKGLGMANPAICMRDGFSTGGSPGTGLGAISRLSTVFDIFSVPGLGTAVLSQYWPKISVGSPRQVEWEIGALCLPKPGETVSGDGCAWKEANHALLVLVTDGLGHGPLAATASLEAIKAFHAHVHLSSLGEILGAVHDALRSTRGAAVALARVDPRGRIVRFAGVGNISGVIFGPAGRQNMVSHSGIVGSTAIRIHEFEYPWFDDATLVMYSDGISSRWGPDIHPSFIKKHPSLVAGVLYRDHGRGTDDSTIVVVRQSLAQFPAEQPR